MDGILYSSGGCLGQLGPVGSLMVLTNDNSANKILSVTVRKMVHAVRTHRNEKKLQASYPLFPMFSKSS